MLNFHYIRNGLMNGEQCIYLVVKDENNKQESSNDRGLGKKKNVTKVEKYKNEDQTREFIKQDMSYNGIDVSRFLVEGFLHIETITTQKLLDHYKNSSSKRDGHKLLESILPDSYFKLSKHFPSKSTTSHRLVLDLGLESNMSYKLLSYILELEESYHFAFHGLHGSSICNYPVQDIEATLKDYSEYGKLVNIRLNNHNGVIFARKFGKGLALVLERH